MSLDLVVNSAISSDAQFVTDQEQNSSILSLSSEAVGIGTETPNAPLCIKAISSDSDHQDFVLLHSDTDQVIVSIKQGANGNGNVKLFLSDGTEAVRLAGGGITVNEKVTCEKLRVDDGSNITFKEVPAASTAPNPDQLESLLIDPSTGKLYYQ